MVTRGRYGKENVCEAAGEEDGDGDVSKNGEKWQKKEKSVKKSAKKGCFLPYLLANRKISTYNICMYMIFEGM